MKSIPLPDNFVSEYIPEVESCGYDIALVYNDLINHSVIFHARRRKLYRSGRHVYLDAGYFPFTYFSHSFDPSIS